MKRRKTNGWETAWRVAQAAYVWALIGACVLGALLKRRDGDKRPGSP